MKIFEKKLKKSIKKGYSCGARTEARFRPPPRNTPAVTPAAGAYQGHVTELKKYKESAVPFNTSGKFFDDISISRMNSYRKYRVNL